jgi:enediyne biosynthesis protein E4
VRKIDNIPALKREILSQRLAFFFTFNAAGKLICCMGILAATASLLSPDYFQNMVQRFAYYMLPVAVLFLWYSCGQVKTDNITHQTLFTLLPASQTGINFNNTVADTRDMNIFNYHNFYNGGGVAIGDVNNDGRPDIFFTANQQASQLYLNKGHLSFENITANAGITSTHRWHTGVTMVDINGDGWLDIYVCNSGNLPNDDRANELFINQQNGTFKESAHVYGLDDRGESTQAVFFDYDHDNDLDCFVLNNSHRSIESFGYDSKQRSIRDPGNGDRFYRNDAGRFTDVSAAAGIYGSEIGFGLGVAVSDVNNDGWDDMYVCNDFFERDYLYLNNKNGSFKEVITAAMGHISNGSMGCDMADINNDGWLDIFTAEMLPETDYRLKTTLRFDEYDMQNARNKLDFHHQFTGNCLQLNNQDGTYSEIAQLAGVDATSWSWSTLCFDFDNDGWKDIYVCNGLSRDLTDQDFLDFVATGSFSNKVKEGTMGLPEFIGKMPAVPQINYGFLNQQNLQFKNASAALGFTTPSFSSGAAYADLDADGDADLVVNNVNLDAFVYRNNATESLHHHFIKIQLHGDAPNAFGYGAKVTVFSGGNRQLQQQNPTRGFESSVDQVLTFGLGSQKIIDSIQVVWPGNKTEIIKAIVADTTLQLFQSKAVLQPVQAVHAAEKFFTDITATAISGAIQHRENDYVDFDAERLIPKMLSTQGPKLAVADVDNDGLQDFYMGSAAGDTAKIFMQRSSGGFVQKPQPAFINDTQFENTGAVFFDADADGDQDLVAVAGGNQLTPGAFGLLARLYFNDGKGSFSRAEKDWPAVPVNASCVRIGDANGDGKPDIFIGTRSVPGSYGIIPASFLLVNQGGGRFTDNTAAVAPDLLKLGMVTDAQWTDINADGKQELVVIGDWMPVTILSPVNGRLQKTKELPNSSGWWNCLTVADLNSDGHPDLVAGNNGLNTRIKASNKQPAKLYVDDFDKNGQTECIPVYYKTDGKAYPYFLKGELEAQLPMLKKKFLHFNDYAGKSIEQVLTPEQLQHATILTVNETRSAVCMNDGKGNFTVQPLPTGAQLAPVFGAVATDFNADGLTDLLLAGNFYGLKPQTGRFDASYGVSLLADGKGNFSHVLSVETGFFVKGEARDARLIPAGNGENYLVVAMNNAPLYIFRHKKIR